jgi:LytS/YehU family sensor histidine kinase
MLVDDAANAYAVPMNKPSAPPLPLRSSPLPTSRELKTVLAVSAVVGALSNPVFVYSPFAVVFLRSIFVGLVMLMAFTLSGNWRQDALRRSSMQVLAVGLAAWAASLPPYLLLALAGPAAAVDPASKLVSGYASTSVLALVIGLLMARAALRHEREERARTDAVQAELDRSAMERELLDARLRLLQAQIEPHFLFNTLANIEALVESGSDKAAPVLRHLIAYLRAAMPRLSDADATLESELQLVRAYLELMRMRMPDRLQFTIAVAPELCGIQFPAMALLTLVENAVRHGIDPSTEGGSIEVGGTIDRSSGMVTLSVSDTGAGMAETAQPGTGLANVRTRLNAFFGPHARLHLHEAIPHGLRVELIFPPRSAA